MSFSIEAAKQKGRPLPEWYLDEPQIDVQDVFYLEAFYNLSTCRQIGMGTGPIPFTAIYEYIKYKGLNKMLAEVFNIVIRALDAEYLKWVEANKPKE